MTDKVPQNNDNKQQIINRIRKDKFLVRPLRTYKDDVASFVKKGKVSTSKIVLAETSRKREREDTQQLKSESKKIATGFKIAVVLVILGVLAIITAMFAPKLIDLVRGNRSSDTNNEDPALLDKIGVLEVVTDNRTNTAVKSFVADYIKNPPLLSNRQMIEIQIVKNKIVSETSVGGKIEKVPTVDFVSILELTIPDNTLRSLHTDYLFGLIQIEENTVPFILFKATDFERVFAGMFEWEKFAYRSINDIFFQTLGSNDYLTSELNTSTSTTESGLNFNPYNFTDVIIYNRDSRALVNKDGKILFFYTFLDSDYLLLTSNTSVVEQIISKLNLQKLIR